MKTAATFLAATALASTSYASTVRLETTKCLNANIPLEQFDIEIGTSAPVAKDLPAVCGLRILSASDSIDVTTIQCQAFRDTEGTQPGSAVFTYASFANIATNPIQEKSILCTIPSAPSATVLGRRQDTNETTTSSAEDLPTSSAATSTPESTVLITSIASDTADSTSSVAPSTIVSTIVVSASSGLPTSSGNATTPSNTGRPSATQSGSGPAESTGAAGAIGIGAGVVVGAFAALFL
ncbi:hypothetical protein N0V83_004055 [Neocucurbitaria cava]|uniref:Uncharacterized protein n=1 Tax=Neocucurbitaria cava TaxID=798079 RepID=A0A9W8YA28_9PLEO|nr:hypothetical protein N0V83_004055 [Neocucurbitaria cava]